MQNLKICFEGPSAVGKSTLARLFSTTHHIIQEVNELFPRPSRADKFWYLKRQLERYQIAKSSTRPVVFDGDPFQPLWYNWIFPPTFLTTSELHTFYQGKILDHQIAFPDLYFVFHIDMRTLVQRKQNDTSRKRRNFEKHLKLIEPQLAYFKFIAEQTMIPVEFVQFDTLKQTYQKVEDLASISTKPINQMNTLLSILEWLQKTSPNPYNDGIL